MSQEKVQMGERRWWLSLIVKLKYAGLGWMVGFIYGLVIHEYVVLLWQWWRKP